MKNVVLSIFTLAACASGTNLYIVPTFDASITSDPNHAAIENTIDQAIAVYEATFVNPITVAIYFQEGGGLGQSNFYDYTASYSAFHSGLTANNANPAAISALNSNGGSGGNNPVTGDSTITMKSANMRAVGINQAPGCQLTSGSADGVPYECGGTAGAAYDGIISLNTSITTPGSPGSSLAYSLLATAEHEIDEVLGLGSALFNDSASTGTLNASNDAYGDPSPEDLFRWSAATGGSRTLSVNCASPGSAYFAYGPSTGAIAQFNNACNGADFGDWASSGTPHVQDAYATAGASPTLGTSEIDALTAIGYIQSSSAPEPATVVPVALGLLGLALRRKK